VVVASDRRDRAVDAFGGDSQRSPGGVASVLSMPWAEKGELASWGDDRHLLVATRWAFEQEVASTMLNTLGPSRCLILRYEDVAAEPHPARLRIAKLIGREDGVRYQKAPDNLVLPWNRGSSALLTK